MTISECVSKKGRYDGNRKHGMSGTRVHCAWSNMKQRCLNPRSRAYPYYGGRGITVCKRWLKFENFFADLGECPAGLTLGRIDNDKGYFPGNCRWETYTQQANNLRRRYHLITWKGTTQTLAEWSRRTGVDVNTLASRLKRGWPVGRTLLKPVEAQKKDAFVTYDRAQLNGAVEFHASRRL